MGSALDDVRQKLEVNNLVVQNEAIAKLSRIVRLKLKQDKGIHDKFPEMDLVWDKSCDLCPRISDGMCRILISIVVNSDGQADLYHYVMNGLTIRIPSARNANSLIVAVKDMLIMQIFKEIPVKYNLRSPVHPFVHILQNRPTVWPLLYNRIESIFNQNTIKFHDAFDIVKPFLRYVFFNPSPSSFLSEFRSLLFAVLVSKSKTNKNEEVMSFLFQSPFWIQSECVDGSIETSKRLREIASIVIESSISDDGIEPKAGNLLLCLVSHCYQMNKLGLDVESCLSVAEKLTEKLIGFESIPLKESSILVLCSLMMEVSSFSQRRVIRICSLLLSKKRVSNIVSGFLVFPLVAILSIPIQELKTEIPLNLLCNSQPKAVELLRSIECNVDVDSTNGIFDIGSGTFLATTNFNVHASESYHVSVLAQEVAECPIEWLEHLKAVTSDGRVPVTPTMLCILCSLAVRSHNMDEIRLCVDVITLIAIHDVDHASGLFSFLMYLLKQKKHPDVRLYIYKSIPCFGKHKVCVAPILRFLSTLYEMFDVRGFSLRLMCSLWQRQVRVYPHLHKWIVDSDDGTLLPLIAAKELAIAKAASIADVCRLKPRQHGADLLTTLSKIVANEQTVDGTTVSALAIDSIAVLCKQEVIDVRTTWMFLVRVVGNDERPLVVKKLCELLSIVEDLAVETSTYEAFVLEAASWLWYRACHFDDPSVTNAAYKALCHFCASCHSLNHLPAEVKERTKIPPEFQSKDPGVRPEDVIPYVPGSSYVDLLMTVSIDVLPGCGEFFVNLVRREVEDMPHYVLHKSRLVAARKTVTTNRLPFFEEAKALLYGTNLSECPPKLCNSAALGLLIAFDPPNELDKDGNPTTHSFLKRGSSYRRMLDVLLTKAQMDTDDWRKCLYYPRAWASFMERVYHALIQARIVQIELHVENDTFVELTEDPKVLKNNAWLWARDKVSDVLKEASRGKPTVHSNAVLALAGLSGAVVNYFIANGDFDDSSSVSVHLAHKHWMNEVCKAFLRVLNPVDEPASGTFGWAFVTSASSNSSHILGLLAVLIADVLIGMDVELVRDVLLSLHERLFNNSSTTGQFYLGVGIGLLTAQLVSKNFVDFLGNEAKQFVLQSALKLKNLCFDDDFHSKHGALLGLAVVSTTLAFEDDKDMEQFSVSVKEEFALRLRDEPRSSLTYGILCFGFSLLLSTDPGNVEDAYDLYCKLGEEFYPSCIDVAASRGLLAHYLASTKPELYSAKRDDLFTSWISTFIRSASETSKSAALVGTYALVLGNFEIRFIQGSQRDLASNVDTHRLRELTVNVTQFLKSIEEEEEDSSGRSDGLWILSSLVLCLSEMEEYFRPSCELSFLSDKSVLKCAVDFIQRFVTSSQRMETIPRLLVCLRSLACETVRPYPAINWNRLLSPLLHITNEVQEWCIEIAIRRSSSSPSASMFLTSVMIGTASVSLKEGSRIRLYRELPVTLRCVTAKTWHLLLERNLTLIFKQRPTSSDAVTAFVMGVAAAIKVVDPPADVVQILYVIMASIFNRLDPEEKVAWDIFCESAWELPDDILDQMSVLTSENCLKVLMFRCSFVASGKQPVTWLNDCIDVVASSVRHKEDFGKALMCLLKCFRGYGILEAAKNIEWFLEFMGHLRNVIGGHSSLTTKDDRHSRLIVSNLFLMFAASAMGCSRSHFLFCCCVQSFDSVGDKLLRLLPVTLRKFLSALDWTPHIHKVVDFLIAVVHSSSTVEAVKQCSKDCLLNLRELEAFTNTSVWTRVIDL